MVTLSETAAKKIADLRLEEGKPEWGLRVRIVGGAKQFVCSVVRRGCAHSQAETDQSTLGR